jgi:hypothetical protein
MLMFRSDKGVILMSSGGEGRRVSPYTALLLTFLQYFGERLPHIGYPVGFFYHR